SECAWIIQHHKFKYCFQDLYKLDCNYYSSPLEDPYINSQLLDKLADACRNIQNLHVDCYAINSDVDHSLSKLIKEQNRVQRLCLIANGADLVLSKNFKDAILIHSNSLIDYYSDGEHNLDSLIPNFQNLK